VKKQPPQKGFVHWDRGTFEKLQAKDPEPLESRFEVSFQLLLSLLQSETTQVGGGYGRLVELIGRAHLSPYVKAKQRVLAAQRFRALRKAGLLLVKRIEGYRGSYVRPAPGLQKDFSLHHTLALYLLDTLPRLPRESETYALDLLSTVESILEDPDPILWKQLDRARGEAVARMKAEGLEYDERMAKLEEVEYPKPNRDFVYATFNEFAARHPWVGQENIRPKSVAREMVERLATFDDYVREYELQRSEGLLLRYLSEAYKALVQTVPEGYRDEAVDDVVAFLRATVRGVDSSLLDEWERLRDPSFAPVERVAAAPGELLADVPRAPDADPRAFAARVRNELHRLVKALANRFWDDAAAAIFDPAGEWTPARLEQELAAYYAEHAWIDQSPRSRKPEHTFLEKTGARTYAVRQRLVDPDGEVDWMVEGAIDLSAERPDDAPLVELVRVGT
jgi:hypothetical protein